MIPTQIKRSTWANLSPPYFYPFTYTSKFLIVSVKLMILILCEFIEVNK